MDPDNTLREIDAFLAEGREGAEVDDLCEDLREWLDRGGFQPDWLAYSLGTSYYRSRLAGRRIAARRNTLVKDGFRR